MICLRGFGCLAKDLLRTVLSTYPGRCSIDFLSAIHTRHVLHEHDSCQALLRKRAAGGGRSVADHLGPDATQALSGLKQDMHSRSRDALTHQTCHKTNGL